MANSAQPIKDNSRRNLNEGNLRDAAEDIKGNATEMLDNFSSKGRRFLEDAQGRAGELYDLSNNWVQENRLVTLVGVAALAGVLGFFIGRRGSEDIDQIEI